LDAWRNQLLSDLGGEENITAAQLALVDEVCTVRLYGQILDYRLRSHQGARSLPWFRTRQRPMAES